MTESRTINRPIGPHSRVLARGSLGGRISGRSREGRFLRAFEADLIQQLGGPERVSSAQRILVTRIARAALRLELMDEEMAEKGEISAHAARVFSALSNLLRLGLRELGLRAKPKPEPTLDEVLRSSTYPGAQDEGEGEDDE